MTLLRTISPIYFDIDVGVEEISDASFCPDKVRLGGIRLELSSQAQDENVDASVENLLVMNAARRKQLLPAEDLLGRSQKGDEQVEFAGSQLDFLAFRCSEPPMFQAQPPTVEEICLAILVHDSLRTVSQARANTRKKFPHTERLCDVVDGAELKSNDLVGFIEPVAADDDDRRVGLACQAAHDFQPVLVTEVEVDNDEIYGLRRHYPCYLGAACDRGHPHCELAQIVRQQTANGVIVVYNKYVFQNLALIMSSATRRNR
jgi:hypothetical protein